MRGLRRHSILLLLLAAGTALWAQDLKQFEKRVTEFTLASGLHFIVVERHEAPVVSFHTWVDAGAVDDPAGATGLAHLFEHLAFKGTAAIGTTNWSSEKKALDDVAEIQDRLNAERSKGAASDQERLDVLELQLGAAINRADGFADPAGFSAILEAHGAVGLRAASSYDHIRYECSLPSNRLELWFLMESQRLLSPVFREFYKEREAMLEEQRVRVDSNPRVALMQEFLAAAFVAQAYHRPELGWPSDVANLQPADARAFFDKYFTAGNVVIAIVGDVNPVEVRRLAESYFGPMPPRPAPRRAHTLEPTQRGARRVQIESPGQPLLVCGYKRPGQRDPDDPVFRVLGLILTSGHTGMLYQELVRDQRIAIDAQTFSAYPNGRFPSMFTFVLAPSKEHTVEEVEKALDALVARLRTQPVDDEALTRARNSARAALFSQLGSNQGLASLLPAYYSGYGDWRELFASIDALDKVTAEDVQRVARKYMIPSQRTVAYIAPAPPLAAQPPQPAGGRP